MTETVTDIDIHSEHDLKDMELCNSVGMVLTNAYPDHLWMVTGDHKSGMVYVELPYDTSIRAFPYGMALHIKKMGNAKETKKKIVRMGGELLERFNLARGKASDDVISRARENGLDSSNAV